MRALLNDRDPPLEVVISAFTLFGSIYARKCNRTDALIGLYVAFLGLSKYRSHQKIVEFNLGFPAFTPRPLF